MHVKITKVINLKALKDVVNVFEAKLLIQARQRLQS